jgi:integrase/recombinase XerD
MGVFKTLSYKPMLFFKKRKSVKFSEAGRLYLEHCDAENILNHRSLAKYKIILRWIMDIIGDVEVKDIDREIVLKMKQEYKARNLKPLAIAVRFTVLKNILRFCREELLLDVFDPDRIRRPKIPKRKVDYLTAEELGKFFGSISKRGIRNIRLRAFLSTLISTGCRISEALDLELNDIDFERKEALIIGKGDKQRKLYFTDWSMRCISDYLKIKKDKSKFLFSALGRAGNRWDLNDAERNFRNHRNKSGLSKSFSAQTIRHSFATHLLRKEIGLGHIQVLLGHSNIQTTSKYYLGVLEDKDAKRAHGIGMDMDLG